MAAIQTRDYYRLSPQEALRALNSRKTGLTPEEATERLANHAENVISLPQKKHPLGSYAKHYAKPLVILLLLSSVLAYTLDNIPAAGILLGLALLNATLTWLQKAPAMHPPSPQELIPAKATVVRQGDTQDIPSAELAVGDVVYIEKGMLVPADIRLIEEEKLSISDTVLTGHAEPKRKGTQPIRGHATAIVRHNTVLAGCSVQAGHAIGVVYATGDNTELASVIHHGHKTIQHLHPLQHTIERIGTLTTLGTISLCVLLIPTTIALGLPRDDALLYILCIAAGLTPLGLIPAVHLVLTRAAATLRRHKAAVTTLSTVDALATTNAILSSTTGVVTKRSWKAERLYMDARSYVVTSKGGIMSSDKQPLNDTEKQHVQLLCTAAVLANHVRSQEHQSPEGAFAALAARAGIHLQHIDKLYREIRAFAFDTARQRASSLRYYGDKKSQKPHLFVTGTPEQVLQHCSKIWDKGKIRPITSDDIKYIQTEHRQLTRKAIHNTGAAYRVMPANTKGSHLTPATAEQELIWLGMVSLANPLREHIANAVAAAHGAHIKVSFVTDAPAAIAKAIAREAGLASHAKELTVITGDGLKRLSNTQVMHLLQRGDVLFSHISHQDKLRLTTLAKEGGKVVAVTGRGLLDAPALTRADVGVALGSSTTHTPETADFVLLDDNFATLVYGIKESRIVSENLVKILRACLTRSAALAALLIGSLVATTLFDIPPALSVLQILVLGLVIELFPLTTLGRDKPEHDPMQQHAHNSYRPLLTHRTLLEMAWPGILVAALAYTNYILFFGRYDIPAGNVPDGSLLHLKATTLALLVIVLCLLVNKLQLRSNNGLFSRHQLHNSNFWMAILLAIATTTALIYNSWLGDFFGVAPLNAVDWAFAVGTTLLFVAIREWQRLSKKHSRKAVLDLHRTHRLRAKAP